MPKYSHDMSEEKKPQTRKLLPEGARISTIVSCEEKTSKAGNQMFVIGFLDKETNYVTETYAVAEKGKRWFLKSVLEACSADPSNWDSNDIIGKDVVCNITHENNEWINREGKTVNTIQHKISDVETLAWDEK